MRTLSWMFGAVVMLAAAVASLPFVLPADSIRAHVIAQVEASTGLSVRVEGPVGFSVWPLLDLVAEEVTVGRGEDLELQAARVRVGLAVGPLMSGNARITELAVEGPILTLATGEEASNTDQPAGASAGSSALAGLSVERFSIRDGTAILLPRDGGAATRIDAINAVLAIPGLDKESHIEAQARLDGRAFALDGTVDSPARLLEGGEARVRATVAADAIMRLPAEIAAQVQYADNRLRLGDLVVSAGESRLDGWAEAVLIGTPYAEAQLVGRHLDVDALMAPPDENRQQPAAGPAADIDFSVLSAFAADIDLSLEALRIAGLDVRPARLSIAIDDGRLRATLAQLGIAGGSLAGAVQIDPTGAVPVVNGTLQAAGLDVAGLAPFIPAPYRASGRLGGDLRFATAGQTMAEFRHNANVAGEIALTGASLAGLGLAEALGDAAADRLDDVSVTVTLTDIREPVRLTGAAAWRGERLELLATGSVAPFVSGGRSDLDVQVASRRFAAGYRGGVSATGAADGDISFETVSLRGLLGWLGRPADLPAGLERFAISGKLALSANALSFNNARVTLDDTTGTGSGRVTFAGRPLIEAELALDRLDVNPYLGGGQAAGGGAPAADWSDAPLDLTGLRAFDAKLELTAHTLIYDRIEASNAELVVSIAEGRLAAELRRLALYGGAGSGQLSVNASGPAPALAARFGLTGLDARPFLVAAADFRRIEGRADMDLDLKATGASQRALVSSMGGTADFKFNDGAIRGIDIPRLARALSEGVLAGWQSRDEDRTEFYELAASFAIESGVARNEDLRLIGPLVNVTGAGSVAMPTRSLDFRVTPQVRANPNEEEVGFGVPVVIKGSWTAPRIYPDIRGILENPAAAYEQLRSLGGGIFRAPAAADIREQVREHTGIDVEAVTRDGRIDREAVIEETIRGLDRLIEGPRSEDSAATEAEPRPSSPTDQLRGLFRQLVR